MQDFFNDLKHHFEQKLGISSVQFSYAFDEYTLKIPVASFLDIMGHLKHSVKFLQLTDITAVDYPKRPERFDIVYHLLNMHRNVRLRVKTSISETLHMPSLSKLYPAANWYEREVFDMFGVVFENHPNLERILTDYTFDAYPLRKDFPTEGRFEVHFDEANHCVVYDPVNLPQARRQFDFMVNPWCSPSYETIAKEDNHG